MEDPPHVALMGAIKNAPLKMSFLLHFFLMSWGMMGYWSRDSYFFYNLLFFITLFWTMHCKDSVDAPLLCMLVDLISIFLDLMTLCIYFPHDGQADRLSAGLALLNMLARPLSAFAVFRVWQDRKAASEGASQTGQGRGYHDIPGSSYGANAPAMM